MVQDSTGNRQAVSAWQGIVRGLISAVRLIVEDCMTPLRVDPALKGRSFAALEVVLYQGVHSIVIHRLSNYLWRVGVPFLPRLISQISRFLTGIEIHPGATIGRRVFIDHGSGVVIGETAVVGNDVLIYHEVTLGGTSLEPGKRHPTVCDGVMIGAGAKLFGPITIGANSQIGSCAVVSKNIPPNSVVVGNPGRIVRREGVKVVDTVDTVKLPDPVYHKLKDMERRLGRLEGGARGEK